MLETYHIPNVSGQPKGDRFDPRNELQVFRFGVALLYQKDGDRSRHEAHGEDDAHGGHYTDADVDNDSVFFLADRSVHGMIDHRDAVVRRVGRRLRWQWRA